MPLAVSIEALYEQHRHAVYRIALRYSFGNVAWAEDVMQDVFIKLCEVVDTLERTDELGGWLYRVTTNLCLSRLERDRFLQATPIRWVLAQGPAPRTPEALAHASAELREAMEVVRDLPPKVSVAFCMKHLDGKEQNEIAETLGLSKGYVSKLLARAEEQLRRAVKGT